MEYPSRQKSQAIAKDKQVENSPTPKEASAENGGSTNSYSILSLEECWNLEANGSGPAPLIQVCNPNRHYMGTHTLLHEHAGFWAIRAY